LSNLFAVSRQGMVSVPPASTSQRGSAAGSKGSADRAPVGEREGGRCRGMERAGSSQIKPLTVNSRADPIDTT